MWLRGFDFVMIEGGRRKEEPAGKPLGAGMSGGRKEEEEPAGKPLDVGTSGERGA